MFHAPRSGLYLFVVSNKERHQNFPPPIETMPGSWIIAECSLCGPTTLPSAANSAQPQRRLPEPCILALVQLPWDRIYTTNFDLLVEQAAASPLVSLAGSITVVESTTADVSVLSEDIILKNSGAVVRIGGDRAFYSPSTDYIQLPPNFDFNGPEESATVALDELSHWTGHPSLLNRDLQNRFGSSAYAMEELRAELASAFVASELGIPTNIPHHASYIARWIKPLKDDKREIFRAAADAQRIASMELGFHPDFAAEVQEELIAVPG
jgi:hypothetical protein